MSSSPNPAAGLLSGRLRHRDALLCGLLCAVWFGLTAGLRPLAIPDEGRYVGVAWEMLRSGDWAVPTLNGAPFFHKPPLFYWITAAAMTVFGPGAWAARTASIVTTTLVATLLLRFISRWGDPRTAWTTVGVLVTTPLFYGSSQYANLDPLVAGCIAAAILCGADAVLRSEAGEPARGPLLGAFTAAAFGVLAKGLIGIVLPLLVLLAWGICTGRLARVARALRWLPGWLAFFAIAAPWFVAMQWRYPDFGHYFFIVQHLDRFASSGFNNAQPFWFYPALLAVGAAPWSPWWLLGLRRAPGHPGDPRGLRALMFVWAATVTVFFSIPQSKPIGYVLPALPPLAWWIADSLRRVGRRRLVVATGTLAAMICVGTVVTEHFLQPKSQAALALQLHARRLAGEPVVFVGNYWFDIPFYAGLKTPVRVVDAWSAADVAKDSWRRELIDAERFAGDGSSRRRPLPADLAAALGTDRSAWVVAPADAARSNTWLASQTLVFEHDGTALWHVSAGGPSRTSTLSPSP